LAKVEATQRESKPMGKSTSLQIPRSLSAIARPDRCALVIYDMQVGILTQLAHGPELLKKVLDVLQIARAHDFRIFFMRHMSLPTKLAGVFQLRQAMAWQRVDSPEAIDPWFLRGSPGFELAPELAIRADEAIFDKISMSAFEGTPLAMALRDCGLMSFMICGIATEIGIDPTVRHGADLGLIPIVIEDACGHGHKAAAERSIENIRFMGDAFVTNVQELRQTVGSLSKD
jgi:nicotinamidase-related amidase